MNGSRVRLVWVLLILTAVSTPWAEGPTVDEARAFVADAEAELLERWIANERAAWVQSNFITDDTQAMAADTLERLVSATARLAKESTRFDGLELPAELTRKIELIKTSLPLAAPADPAKQSELTKITTGLEAAYGKGKYCKGDECRTLGDLSRLLASSTDPAELLDAWQGWRTVSPAMKDEYARFVELGNEGARELGFADLGAMWRSGYDMDPDAFARELDRLWSQVKPLYEALHCHVRARLAEELGEDVVPTDRAIPAHVLGNMWAQSWGNRYDLVAPEGGDAGVDLGQILVDRQVTARQMVEYGEAFFTSLGFAPLPDTFWERSLLTKPQDREVVCHASAWDIDFIDDLRIKMCIEINAEDFSTVHHELGHNFYQRAYAGLAPLYRDSANDGFHEGIGDTVALSITPDYLKRVGLLKADATAGDDVAQLLRMALDKVAFLPFGLLVDQWRWKIFSGEVPPDKYNEAWWQLRQKYQGVRAPIARAADDFDPGAKYHVPANTPYTRYFLAHILQFQFHRALCDASGYEGPLNQCSIYGNDEAGKRLRAMLAMGRSRPWQDALEAMTGQREMDATAILDYFAPLKAWLDAQNAGRTCGW